MVIRYTGNDEKLHITLNGKTISTGWSSLQFDNERFMFRLYCHDDIPVAPLEVGDTGELVVTTSVRLLGDNETQVRVHTVRIEVTKKGLPYTFDDSVVYEFSGKVL